MTIDFTKLLGFDTVSRELATGIDLQDETLSDKLGAKIGPEDSPPTKAFDFQNDTFASRLGAKASVEPRPIKRPANNPCDHAGELLSSSGNSLSPYPLS